LKVEPADALPFLEFYFIGLWPSQNWGWALRSQTYRTVATLN